MTAPRFLPLALTVALAGCSLVGSSGVVSLQTTADAYAPGAEVVLQITNGSDDDLGYNFCYTSSLPLDRLAGGWEATGADLRTVEAPDGGPAACPDVEYRLSPGESVAVDGKLPTDLGPGTYRVRGLVRQGERSSVAVVSNPFEVE